MSAMTTERTVRPAAGVRAVRPAPVVRDASTRAARPTGPSSTLHLTRRGRLVVWTVAALVALGVGGAAGAWADGPAAAPEVRRVVVAPGDTLWGIAAEAASPGEDVRDVVLELMALNELPSGGVQAGQTVVVPAR
ncbi:MULTISPECIES: LysM peptidoglycan-binding domain-containing protein [Cellulomonas]|nr:MULTISPECIES: LysM peptidoglycan-binding domain-containing protein [Cellulomonas]